MGAELLDLPAVKFVVDAFTGDAMTTLWVALLGAFAGAKAAQLSSDRAKNRDELLAEVRAINSVLLMAIAILNTALSLKRQHVKPLKEKFDSERDRFLARQAYVKAGGQQAEEYLVTFDLVLVDFPRMDVESLQTRLFERITAPARATLAASQLSGIIDNLRDCFRRRAELVEGYKGVQDLPLMTGLYFGLRSRDGRIHEEYPNTVAGMATLTDDVLFFSHVVIKDLAEHGGLVLARYKKLVPSAIERIISFDVSQRGVVDLMPAEELYRAWTSGFRKVGDRLEPTVSIETSL